MVVWSCLFQVLELCEGGELHLDSGWCRCFVLQVVNMPLMMEQKDRLGWTWLNRPENWGLLFWNLFPNQYKGNDAKRMQRIVTAFRRWNEHFWCEPNCEVEGNRKSSLGGNGEMGTSKFTITCIIEWSMSTSMGLCPLHSWSHWLIWDVVRFDKKARKLLTCA